MQKGLWPEHPLFSATSLGEAERRLESFDDGLIFLSPSGQIVHLNNEATRQIGIDAATAIGNTPAEVTTACSGWHDLVASLAADRTADVLLHRSDGRAILAVPRRMPTQSARDPITMILLRDLSGLDYRRSRASGRNSGSRIQFLAENRTRPDFATQRQLNPELHRILSRGERAMVQGARILITGESGVGKTEIAKFLHSTVANANDPFVVVNCASSCNALFGIDEDASATRRPSMIEQAEGGTLFLDEVGEIPRSEQASLLGFLEYGLVTSEAGRQYRVANVRVIATTNRDLRQLVTDGKFRADLYYRLAVVPIRVPALREISALIAHLINRFLQTINQRRQTPIMMPQRLRERLLDYSFPGNIRELLNIVQKLVIFMEDSCDLEEVIEDILSPIDIPGLDGALAPCFPGASTFNLKCEVRRYERGLIDKAIRVHGSKRKAASALGVDIGTIVRKTTGRYEPVSVNDEKLNKTGGNKL